MKFNCYGTVGGGKKSLKQFEHENYSEINQSQFNFMLMRCCECRSSRVRFCYKKKLFPWHRWKFETLRMSRVSFTKRRSFQCSRSFHWHWICLSFLLVTLWSSVKPWDDHTRPFIDSCRAVMSQLYAFKSNHILNCSAHMRKRRFRPEVSEGKINTLSHYFHPHVKPQKAFSSFH